jgi:PPOX class probable F420-dependent enzyme
MRGSGHDVVRQVDIDDALTYARRHARGVLVTLKADGRPQLSNIGYAVGDDGFVRISVTDGRAKTSNLRRDPRASLHVTAEDFWSYVVLEGDAQLSTVATDPDDPAADELVDLYRQLQGEHPDWDEYRRAMVADHRLVVRLQPTHAYGMA